MTSKRHVGVSELRKLNSKRLAELEEVLIIHEYAEPISALIPYATFMEWQTEYHKLRDVLSEKGLL